jgi:DNA invertase Pin-like site-specific DNA recombinase
MDTIDSWTGAPPERWHAFYVRVTQEESVKVDLSIPNQIARSREIAGERNWTHYRIYVEPRHVSAELWVEKRPALRHMLEDVAAGRVTAICARHLDRLWRNNDIQTRLLALLKPHRVEVWDFTKQHEYKSAHGHFTLQVLGAASELEVKLTAERIREMKRGKAHKGKTGGGPPPFGYTSQSRRMHDLIAGGTTEDDAYRQACLDYPIGKTWYIDEREAEIVRLALDLYVTRRWGARRIAVHLNANGYKTRNGHVWFATCVRRMINNPVYAGFTTFDETAYADKLPSSLPRRKQERFRGEHPALVSVEVWEKAQQIMTTENKIKRVRAASHEVFSLSGLVTCPKCGSRMIGKHSSSTTRRYYMCSLRHGAGVAQCDFPLIDAAALQRGVWGWLHEILSSPTLVAEHLERMRKKLAADVPDVSRQLAANERRQSETRAAMSKYFACFEQSADPERDAALLERVRELRDELKGLDAAHADLQAKAAPLPQHAISTEHVARYLAKLRARVDERSEVQRTVFHEFRRTHDLRVRALSPEEYAVSISLRARDLLPGDASADERLVAVVTPERSRRGGAGPYGGPSRSEGSVGAGSSQGSVGAGSPHPAPAHAWATRTQHELCSSFFPTRSHGNCTFTRPCSSV